MIRVYCKNQTFLLTAVDGSTMIVKPNNFNEIPEKFTGDPTYKMALAAGAIEKFDTSKQGDKIADNANGGKRGGKGKQPENEGQKAADAE